MIISVNSDPNFGYYTFVIQGSGSNIPAKKYRVNTQQYLIVTPDGSSPWNVTAYNDDHPNDITETWTVSDPDALLTTANEVPSFPLSS